MKSKVLTLLLSAVVAFGLWFYVITVVSPESEKTYYDIPVVLQNKEFLAERGLMIVSDVPKVTLALKSDRTILNDLNEANINVISNVANIEKPGTHNLTYDIAYPGNVPYNKVSVLSSSTDLITVKVENKIKKPIPVVVDYGGSAVPEGFIADLENALLDNETITVTGPESVMKYVHQARIEVDLNNKTKTLVGEYEYTLCNGEGDPVNVEMVTTNVEKVNLTIKIQKVKEVDLVVTVIDGGGATKYTSTITVEPRKIKISGSDTLLDQIKEINLGTINLGKMFEDTVLPFPIVLPEGITNETGVKSATVTVKFPQLMMKTFNVTAISAINVPEGLEVDMITQAIPVTVRGPIALVQNMKETDFTVTVDFIGAQIGTATMKAEVKLNKNYSSVGAVGTYQVSATLREPKEDDQ